MWFSAPSFWIGGGLESRCVGRVYGADGAVRRYALPTLYLCVLYLSENKPRLVPLTV